MPRWASRHAREISALPFRALRSVAGNLPDAMTIHVALLQLTIAAFVVTYLSTRSSKQSLWAYLMFGGIVAMLANVFAPHLPATLVFGSYTPGVVIALLINLPVMSWLALRAVREGWVSGRKAVAFGAGVPVALGAP